MFLADAFRTRGVGDEEKSLLCQARYFCLAIWLIAHLATLSLLPDVSPVSWGRLTGDLLQSGGRWAKVLASQQFPVYALILSGTFLFVPLVHRLDRHFRCVGIRSMLALWNRGTGSGGDAKGQERRDGLRIEMITIKSGFGATLFLLCIDLHIEKSRTTDYPSYVISTMACFFLFSTLLNLVQLVLYDAVYSPELKDLPPEQSELVRRALRRKIRVLRLGSWQSLVAPTILALTLVNLWIALLMNLVYGLILYYYYFLPEQVAFDLIDKLRDEAPPETPEAKAARAGLPWLKRHSLGKPAWIGPSGEVPPKKTYTGSSGEGGV